MTTQDRLQRHFQKKELEQLLKRLEGVTIGGIVPKESLPAVQQALSQLFLVEAEPFSTIRGEASGREKVEWLRQVVREFLAGGSELYVVFSGLGAAGWVHLIVDGEGRWVRSLWEVMPDREVFFASADWRRVLAITEEEAFHGAYLGHVE
ncbi:hypothetical protein BO221_44265 [Archangium sp. Cb G35]|uniref:hypothetical protein n=1 Tax=Archangium sp. Cb G35 TaxID=1920190 RepID=UPI0009359C9B|nr:hypothetical protein [Archangium sp. Cb G35]OJT17587.1 hypothetical protein BO221_44265 [Archangium sp. Cb G35]